MLQCRTSRRRGVLAPLWAPTPVGVGVSSVCPLEQWVVLSEEFEQDRVLQRETYSLVLATTGTPNTVYGKVLGIHPSTARELGVVVGDRVIYREWEGGRWDLVGQVVLIISSEHVLARCDEQATG